MNPYYTELQTTFQLPESISSIISTMNKPTSVWPVIFGFECLLLGKAILDIEPFASLQQRFKLTPVIIKLKPFTYYDWHIDEGRLCAINMLIGPARSNTLFREVINYDTSKIIELQYAPSTLYAFNVAKEHSITNFESERLLLSVAVLDGTYTEVVEFCKSNNL